jgi:hypothetical protein
MSPYEIEDFVPYSRTTVKNWLDDYESGGEKQEWGFDGRAGDCMTASGSRFASETNLPLAHTPRGTLSGATPPRWARRQDNGGGVYIAARDAWRAIMTNRSHRANRCGTLAERHLAEEYHLNLDRCSWHDARDDGGTPWELKATMIEHLERPTWYVQAL